MERTLDIESMPGTLFQRQVWRAIADIPRGCVRTYTQLARDIGRPTSARAVANACGTNPLVITIPCHRVVRSDGGLGGYSGAGGIATKRKLLESEGIDLHRLGDFLY